MGKLIIRPGTVDDVDPVQSIANEAKTLPFLGGFTMRDVLVSAYEKNEKFPYNIVAELDGEIVGFSDSKDRNVAYTEYDLVAVKPELRRQRIGSALYTYHLLKSALQGKKFMKDQTIHFNTVMQDGYLPTLGFSHIAGLRGKIRNFSTINWWMMPIEVDALDRFYNLATSGPHEVEFSGLNDLKLWPVFGETHRKAEDLCNDMSERLILKQNSLKARKLLEK